MSCRVSRSHTDPHAIKTDAPLAAVWDVLRCWVAEQVVAGTTSKKPLSSTSPGFKILATPPATQADFRPWPAAQQLLSKRDSQNEKKKLGKFMPNPEGWGPGSRGTAHSSLVDAPMPNHRPKPTPAAEAAADANDGGSQHQREKRLRNQGKKARKRQALTEGDAHVTPQP